MSKYFVTGIGTGIGKTVVAAVCAEALQGCYWKPIQAGDLANSDSRWVASRTQSVDVLPERFRLTEPMSPHAAARIDGVTISLNDFELPDTGVRSLIVEGAGGLLVPINDTDTILDIIEQLGIPVLVVSQNYLGSINHTLLTISVLRARNVSIAGIIFNGNQNRETETAIESLGGVRALARIPHAPLADAHFVSQQATLLRGVL